MANIYNRTTSETYHVGLIKTNGFVKDGAFSVGIVSLPGIDTEFRNKWDDVLDMYAMNQQEIDDFVYFWNREVRSAFFGRSTILKSGVYYFWCERNKEV